MSIGHLAGRSDRWCASPFIGGCGGFHTRSKKYDVCRPVGIDVVRTMYGSLNIYNASHAMVATTSRFTAPAQGLAKQFQYQLSLRDEADVFDWITTVNASSVRNKT